MGLACYLTVHQAEGVEFKDLPALNAKLAKAYGINELVDFDTPPPAEFDGWLKQEADGSVLLSNCEEHTFQGYEPTVEVWGCWTNDAAKLIAKGLKAGKLVFHLEIEGNDDIYTVITPGKFEDHGAPAVRF